MRIRLLARHLTLTLLVLGLLITAAPAAFAQPTNDDFADATEVTTPLPFTDEVNTVDATSAADDPQPGCVETSRTVWYAFTAPETQFIQADTFDSNFDTTLSVWTGARGALEEVACDDDSGPDLQSRVNFEATAGTTYYFMVGSFGEDDGGDLVFTVDVGGPPFVLEAFDVDERGSVNPKAGTGTISGTVTCSGGSGTVFIDGFARQRTGRVFIDGFFSTAVECSGETAAWSAELIGENGLFTGGRVDVEAFAFAEDDGSAEDFTTVRLRGKGKR